VIKLNPIIGQRKSIILPTIQQMNSYQHTLHPRSKTEKTRKTKSVNPKPRPDSSDATTHRGLVLCESHPQSPVPQDLE
jgi:hypothetical protein